MQLARSIKPRETQSHSQNKMNPLQIGLVVLLAIVGLGQAAHISEPSQLVPLNGKADLEREQAAPNVISGSATKQQVAAESSGDLSYPMKTLQRQALSAPSGSGSDSDKLKRGILSVFRKSSPGNYFVPSARSASAHSAVAQLPSQHHQHQVSQPTALAPAGAAAAAPQQQQQQQQQQPGSQPSGEQSASLVGGAETTGDLLNRQNRLKPNGSLFRWGRR